MELTPTQWIARCALRLGERWRTVDPVLLEEVAVGIWQDEGLRVLSPEDAASRWLQPVGDEAR